VTCAIHRGATAIVLLGVSAACSEFHGEVNRCKIVWQAGEWMTGNEGSFEYHPVLDPVGNRCPINVVQPGERVFTGGHLIGIQAFDGTNAWPNEVADVRIDNSRAVTVAGARYQFRRESIDWIEADVGLGYPTLSGHGTFAESDLLHLEISKNCCNAAQFIAGLELQLTYTPDGSARVGVTGNSVPLSNTPTTWQASSPSAGRPHTYTWYRDGAALGSGDSYTADSGPTDFGLRVDMTDTYGRTASTLFPVDVDGMIVTVAGPDSVFEWDGGRWSVGVRGGYPPYSTRWYRNSTAVGTGTSYQGIASTNYTLRAEVTDAHGSVYRGSRYVTVLHSSDCTTTAC
jgi:hypothetical protein